MNVGTLTTIARILADVRINRMTDREQKNVLLKGFVAIRLAVKESDAEKDEIISKFQSDWADELASVEEFRKEGRPVVGHDAYLEAEADANRALAEIDARDVGPLEIKKVSADALCDPELWPEDIVLGQIPATLDYLIENGVAK